MQLSQLLQGLCTDLAGLVPTLATAFQQPVAGTTPLKTCIRQSACPTTYKDVPGELRLASHIPSPGWHTFLILLLLYEDVVTVSTGQTRL